MNWNQTTKQNISHQTLPAKNNTGTQQTGLLFTSSFIYLLRITWKAWEHILTLLQRKGLQKEKQSVRIPHWIRQECGECKSFLQQQKTLKCFERGEQWGVGGKGRGSYCGQGSSATLCIRQFAARGVDSFRYRHYIEKKTTIIVIIVININNIIVLINANMFFLHFDVFREHGTQCNSHCNPSDACFQQQGIKKREENNNRKA